MNKSRFFTYGGLVLCLLIILAGCSREENLWRKTQSSENIEAYEEYLMKYPQGRYVKEAKSKIVELLKLFPITKDGKMGYIDDKGKIRIEPRYDFAGELSEDMALIKVGDKWGFINKLGEEIVKPQYEEIADFSEGLAMVKSDGKWGYIDKEGRLVIPPQFDDAWSFSEGFALVKVKDKWGVISRDGKIAIDATYEGAYHEEGVGLELLMEDGRLLHQIEGTILITETGEVYLLGKNNEIESLGKTRLQITKDYKGKQFVKKYYEYLSKDSLFGSILGYKKGNTTLYGIKKWIDNFSESYARVIIDGKWGYIDKTGTIRIKPQFEYCSRFKDGLAVFEAEGRFGVIDKSGNIVIKPKFKGISKEYSEGFFAVTTTGNKWGYIDLKGQMIIKEQFKEACLFKEGLACVNIKGKWGYIDKTGKIVVKPQFEDARSFSEGFAGVKLGNKWGYIDKTGNVVIKPEFNDVDKFKYGIAKVTVEEKINGKVNYVSCYITKSGKFIYNEKERRTGR